MAIQCVSSAGMGITDGQSNGGAAFQITETLSGTDWQSRSYTATTSWTALPIGSLASFDEVCIQNSDATNYVEMATANDGSGIFSKMTPGRFNYVACNPIATYYVKANTASCVLKFAAREP